MAKVVYNACYGGFSLSPVAIARYAELSGKTPNQFGRGMDRADPNLVKVVEELGQAADGSFSALCIRELAPGTRYRIDEYDGFESVMTVDEYEWSVA